MFPSYSSGLSERECGFSTLLDSAWLLGWWLPRRWEAPWLVTSSEMKRRLGSLAFALPRTWRYLGYRSCPTYSLLAAENLLTAEKLLTEEKLSRNGQHAGFKDLAPLWFRAVFRRGEGRFGSFILLGTTDFLMAFPPKRKKRGRSPVSPLASARECPIFIDLGRALLALSESFGGSEIRVPTLSLRCHY